MSNTAASDCQTTSVYNSRMEEEISRNKFSDKIGKRNEKRRQEVKLGSKRDSGEELGDDERSN